MTIDLHKCYKFVIVLLSKCYGLAVSVDFWGGVRHVRCGLSGGFSGSVWCRGGRVGAGLVVVLVGSSLVLSEGVVVAEESEGSPVSGSSPGGGAVGPAASSGGWWDGSGVLAAAPPAVSGEGWCGFYGGWLGLFDGGAVAKVCSGDAGAVSGSPRGVGWLEGYDAGGSVAGGLWAGVELFGAPGIGAGTYRALGVLDVVFDGGTFGADFSSCTHRAEVAYSSCVTRLRGVSVPPGGFVGVATPGAEPPAPAPRGVDGSARTPAAERAALIALYDAAGGADWSRDTNWNSAAPVRMWYGVTTNDEGSVTHLYLSGNGLSGAVAPALGDLTNLTSLDLSDNGLSGSVPPELGDLANLVFLSLHRNGLSGSVPPELGDLTNLTYAHLDRNGFSGAIPSDLGDLANLQWLDLGRNDLSGVIPSGLGGLTNLRRLYLYNNGLSGVIPPEVGDLTNLTHLDLSVNRLSGSIPAELGDLTNLNDLNLHDNALSGPIPPELGDLTNLTRLYLSDNSLSGCVPAALAAVADIRFDADLSHCEAPELLAAVLVGGSAIELIYDSTLDNSTIPAPSTWTVTADDESQTITTVAIAGRVVTLTLASQLPPTQSLTASYTAPTTTDTAGIQSTNGEAATGFTDHPVTIPPDPPTITSIESTAGGLTVSWEPVANITGYDIEWRQDGEATAQSTRTGLVEQHTIGGLTTGALYWVRVRAANTNAATPPQTLYTTDWSAEQPGVAGDWTPQNLTVTPRDRMLAITWDAAAGADDYEVEYRPDADGAGTVGRGAGAARSVAPPPAVPDPLAAATALAILSDEGWAAHITGLDNGDIYDIEVRATRTITAPSGDVTLRSPAASAKATPGVGFEVHSASGPRVVWSGGTVTWEVTLEHPVTTGTVPFATQPFAYRPIRGSVAAGPSAGTPVRCVWNAVVPFEVAQGVYRPCVTDDEGKVTLQYRAAVVQTNSEVGVDELAVVADHGPANCSGSPAPAGCMKVGSTKIVRPINVVAIGDSYTSGENGDPDDGRADRFSGFYVTHNGTELCERDSDDSGCEDGQNDPVDDPCRRWSLSYAQLLPMLRGRSYNDIARTYACTGAISLNIHHPAELGSEQLNTGRYYLEQRVPEFRSRPSSDETDTPSSKSTGPRQLLSLQRVIASLRSGDLDVDMVVITIGGNDILFSEVVKDCLISDCYQIVDPEDQNFNDTEVGYHIDPRVDELGSRLDLLFALLRDIRIDDVPIETPIFVLGYPHLVASEFGFEDGCTDLSVDEHVPWLGRLLQIGDLAESERTLIRFGNGELNDRIKSAAEDAGVHFVPVAGDFSGHEPCGRGSDWVNGFKGDPGKDDGISDRSLHPNEAGHRAYARALLRYIAGAISSGAELNNAGVPENPQPKRQSSATVGSGRSARTAGAVGAVTGASGTARQREESPGETVEESTEQSPTLQSPLLHRRVVPVASSCATGFVSPGEVMVLEASGFAADATVSVSVRSATAPWATASDSSLPAATADGQGRLEARWTAPTPQGETAPRVYAFEASGARASGGSLVARSLAPLVVYPGTAPCAVADSAATSVGQAVRVSVLGNDVAPAGGSLVASSVSVDVVDGGSFSTDAADGSVTFTPAPGFVGTVVARYRVADIWGVRVGAAVTVTVDAGCTITGAAGVVHIDGTDGDDVICVPDRDDWDAFHTIDAKGGDDVIVGGDGVEWVFGGAGSDVVYGRGGADRIDAGTGTDTIYGGDGPDTIASDDLADSIVDDPGGYEFLLVPPARRAQLAPIIGDDAVYASLDESLDVHVIDNDHDPNENLVATSLSITRAPAQGTAHVIASAGSGVVVRYVAGAVAGVDTFAYEVCDTLENCAIGEVTVTMGAAGCTILGTDGDDELRGTPGADVICGLAGDDVIRGLGGDDILVGGAGDDTLWGGNGDDALFGGAGDDDLYGGVGGDVLWGGAGRDALEGNGGADTLNGGAGADGLIGGGGADVLWGGGGGDSLVGHAGDDILYGGAGADRLVGGNGGDVLWGGAGADRLVGGAGGDVLWGGAGGDTLWGNTQSDALWGGPGADTLYGGGHADALVGGAGDDALVGNAGDDRLWGDTGDDSLDGGNGTDYLDGGDDADACRRAETAARCES